MASKPPSVDEFLLLSAHPLTEGAALFRSALMACDPTLSEQIKWNAPSFGRDFDDRVTMGFRPEELQIVFHRGVKPKDPTGFTFDDPSGLLKWMTKDRAVVRLRSMEEIQSKLPILVETAIRWIKETK